jgi:hypothetical protein
MSELQRYSPVMSEEREMRVIWILPALQIREAAKVLGVHFKFS